MIPLTPALAATVYRRYIAGENARDRAAMQDCLSPTMTVSINGIAQLADREADAAATDRLLAMYPDYRREIRHLGTYTEHGTVVVVAEWTMSGRGTAAGSSGPVPVPDLDVAGCTAAVVGIEADRAVIVSARLYTDPLALAHVL